MSQTVKTVTDAILEIVRMRAPDTREVRVDQHLVRDLALASLDLAELGATLENALDAPLFDGVAMQGFVTVGDLVEHCDQVLAETRR